MGYVVAAASFFTFVLFLHDSVVSVLFLESGGFGLGVVFFVSLVFTIVLLRLSVWFCLLRVAV